MSFTQPAKTPKPFYIQCTRVWKRITTFLLFKPQSIHLNIVFVWASWLWKMIRRCLYVKMLPKASVKVAWSKYYSSPIKQTLCITHIVKILLYFQLFFISDFISCTCFAWSMQYSILLLYLCDTFMRKLWIDPERHMWNLSGYTQWGRKTSTNGKRNKDFFWGNAKSMKKWRSRKCHRWRLL